MHFLLLFASLLDAHAVISPQTFVQLIVYMKILDLQYYHVDFDDI